MSLINQDALKTKVLDLINEKPRTCAVITRDWSLSPNGMTKFSLLCEGIDLNLAKMMMDWISPETWMQVEKLITSKRTTYLVMQEFIQAVILQGMTWEYNEDQAIDPFTELKNLTNEQLKNLIPQFELTEWGLIQAYWNANECMKFVQSFEPSDRRTIALSMEKLRKIPSDSLKETANGFARRVKLRIEEMNFNGVIMDEALAAQADQIVQSIAAKNSAVYESDQAKKPLVEIYFREKELEQRFTQHLRQLDPGLESKVKQIIEMTHEEDNI